MAIHVYRNFFSEADKLRNLFLAHMADPRRLHSERFVWDYWHIENQYSLLRTPATEYFPPKLYKLFHDQLTHFAQEMFGCAQVSTPWLSCYIDGCYQKLHSDVMQGPWAFVFSLTDWNKRNFRGGETLILKDQIMRFWEKPFWCSGLELNDVVESIPAQFNQLLVFDPRVPHGVNELHGSRDPAHGRLVIHGWFMDPCPFVVGGLQKQSSFPDFLQDDLGRALLPVLQQNVASGFLSLRVEIQPNGQVKKVTPLASSLQSTGGQPLEPFVQKLRKTLLATRFPKAKSPSRLVLPFYFE